MIANFINTVIGLVLVYIAILRPQLLEGRVWPVVILGVIIFALSLWARRSDGLRGFSNTNLLLAVLLVALGCLQVMPLPIVTFWGLFWVGMLVAIASSWASLYRPTLANMDEEHT